jgi:hypothetical protein
VQVTVMVEVESAAAPESTLTLPYDPEALATVQLCACAGEHAMAASRMAPVRTAAKRAAMAVGGGGNAT